MSTKPIPCTKCPLTHPKRASLHHHHLDIYCEICSTFIAANNTGWEKAAHMYLQHRIRIPFTTEQEAPGPEQFPQERVSFDPERLAAEAVFPDPNARWRTRNGNGNGDGKRHTNGRFGPSPSSSSSSSSDNGSRPPDAPPDHYAMLGVKRLATHAVIVQAAKAKRIECHPDRVKRGRGLSPAEERAVDDWAKAVGCAAEVLGDRVLRKRFEEEIVEWEVRTGGRG